MVDVKSCGGTVPRLEHQRMAVAMSSPRPIPPRATRMTPLLAMRLAAPGVAAPTAVQEREQLRQPYPNFKVVVLDDDVNTFQHVVECLVRYIPGVNPDQAWALAHRIDGEGSAVVWCGPQEQAELYHQQLAAEGLSMAPLEPA